MKPRRLLTLGLTVASLAEILLRDSPPRIDPEGESPKPKPKPKPRKKREQNTYGLPQGQPVRRQLKKWFHLQRQHVLGTLHTIGAELPTAFAPLANYDDPMASAMTPILAAYWDQSGKETRERIGLDPADWKVTDPHTRRKIHEAAFQFCHATNATTTDSLNGALRRLRQELIAGIVTEGESLDQLTKRVNRVFDSAETWRARRIAATEASRAVHAAQLESARQSGIVVGLEWLVSADACPVCQQIAAEVRAVRLGQSFAKIGDSPAYAEIQHPPAHPGCQCACVEILSQEFGGPENPDFGETLHNPDPPDDYRPPAGVKVPKPEPERLKV